ncbi:MAG: putative sigma-54 modulation protein [Gammaproteobacteria bacterium]|jgi:putative sigma-54 modulation protein|tara:strand:+ start:1147 stop:1467 length:321 start_codon:yes stop_codon:yes gene_type:complete
MQINLSGHHVEVTDALRQYVGDKIKRIERHFDNVTDIQCILTVEKLEHKAEATIHVSGATLFADAVDDNMYAAIDALTDKLDRQVKKHKEKATDHHARDSLKRNVS